MAKRKKKSSDQQQLTRALLIKALIDIILAVLTLIERLTE